MGGVQLLAGGFGAVTGEKTGANGALIDRTEVPSRDEYVEDGEAGADEEVVQVGGLAGNDSTEGFENVGRGKAVGEILHPDGQSLDRIKDAGKRRQHGGNRPDKPFCGRSETKYERGADDTECNTEQKENQYERNDGDTVSKERQTEASACQDHHHEESNSTGENAGEHQTSQIFGNLQRRSEDVQEVSGPDIFEK